MKIYKYIAILALGLSAMSCNSFLDTTPKDFVSPDQFYKNSNDALMALSGIYNGIMNQNAYGSNYSTGITATDDLGYYDRNTVPVGIYNNNSSTADADVYNFWSTLYDAVNNANLFLERIDGANMTDALRTQYKGEAKFLRAYAYFLLAQCWGDVPYQTTSQQSVTEVNIAATPQKAVLDSVVKEMEASEAMVGEIDAVSAGHVSKSAVRGILARVYLKMAGWPLNGGTEMYTKANYWAKQVNKDNKHRLNPDYTQVFINLAADVDDTQYYESIWEAEYKGNRSDGHQITGRLGNTMGIANGNISKTSLGYSYGFISCTLNLWDLYNDVNGDNAIDDGYTQGSDKERIHPDVRRDWNIAPYSFDTNSAGENVKVYKAYKGQYTYDKNGTQSAKVATATTYVTRNAGKYRREYEVVTPRDKNQTPINFPILRYADVLLMIAETENEINNGPTAEAYSAINQVRKRSIAGAVDISGMDYDSFKQLVKNERARELCFEGLRKYDLIRWGDYLSEMKKVAIYTTDSRWDSSKKFAVNYANNASLRYEWLPIPEKELGLNKLLKQNPAWN